MSVDHRLARRDRRERAPRRRRPEGDRHLRLRQRSQRREHALGRHRPRTARVGADPLDRLSAAARAPGVAAVLTAADVPGRKTFGLEFCDQPVLAERRRPLRRRAGRDRRRRDARAGARAPRRGRRPATSRCRPSPTWSRRCAPTRRACTTSATCCATSTSSTATPTRPRPTSGSRATTRPRCRTRRRSAPRAGSPSRPPTAASTSTSVTQWLHVDRQQIAPCLGLPEEKVRITLAGVGGAFGSREDIHVQIHACLLALAHRPAGEDDVRPRGVVPRPRAPAPVADVDPLRRDARRPARRRRRAPAARRRRLRLVVAGGARERLHVRRRPVRGAERPRRGHRRLHEQPAVRGDARLRRAAGLLRVRVGDGRARGEARDRPGRAAAAERGRAPAPCCRPARC